MSANIQAFINYSQVITQSSSVSFFTNTPRWPTASTMFDFSSTYLLPVALTSLLPLIFAAVLLLALIIHLIIRFTLRNNQTNKRIQTLRMSSSKKTVHTLVPLSGILLLFIFVSTSFGLLGNATLNHSSNDTLDIFQALVNDLSRTGFTVVNTSILLRDRLSIFNATATTQSDEPAVLVDVVGDLSVNALETSKVFMLDRYPDVKPLRKALNVLLDSVRKVFETVEDVIFIVYSVIFVIMLIIISAPPLLRIATMVNIPKIIAIFSYLLYLLVPSLLSWLLVGLLTSIGATISDICTSLHDYRSFLTSPSSITSSVQSSNAFIKSGFVCPNGLSGDSLKEQIDNTADSILQSDLARSTITLLLSVEAQLIADLARWTANELPPYLNCAAQIRLSGQLEFVACGKEGSSAIDGIWNLWLAFITLATCLSIAVFASLMGIPVMRALDIWPSAAIPPVPELLNVHDSTEYAKNDEDDGILKDSPIKRRDDMNQGEFFDDSTFTKTSPMSNVTASTTTSPTSEKPK